MTRRVAARRNPYFFGTTIRFVVPIRRYSRGVVKVWVSAFACVRIEPPTLWMRPHPTRPRRLIRIVRQHRSNRRQGGCRRRRNSRRQRLEGVVDVDRRDVDRRQRVIVQPLCCCRFCCHRCKVSKVKKVGFRCIVYPNDNSVRFPLVARTVAYIPIQVDAAPVPDGVTGQPAPVLGVVVAVSILLCSPGTGWVGRKPPGTGTIFRGISL